MQLNLSSHPCWESYKLHGNATVPVHVNLRQNHSSTKKVNIFRTDYTDQCVSWRPHHGKGLDCEQFYGLSDRYTCIPIFYVSHIFFSFSLWKIKMASLKFISVSAIGFNSKEKREKFYNLISDSKFDVIFLQETHFVDKYLFQYDCIWNGKSLCSLFFWLCV